MLSQKSKDAELPEIPKDLHLGYDKMVCSTS